MNISSPVRTGGHVSKVDPAEIFKRIDQVESTMSSELEPGLLERILSKDKRETAKMLAQAKSEAIRARRELITGLADTMLTYVDVHVGDLKIRGHAHVAATFTEMFANLSAIMEATVVSHLDNFGTSAERISRMPHLSDAMREEQITRAYERAEEAEHFAKETFKEVLGAMKKQFTEIVAEIGRPG